MSLWQYVAAALLLALMGAGGRIWWLEHDLRQAEIKAEHVAAAQAERDATAAAAFANAVQERDEAEKQATAANRTIYEQLEPKLAASVADGTRLARLLHNALQARDRNRAAAANPDQPGITQSTGEPSSTGAAIEAATAEYDATCVRDAARLTALQAEIAGQM